MAHAVCYPLMYAGVSAVRPKERQHVCSTQWPERAKGPYAAIVTCSHHLCLLFVWQSLQYLLTPANGVDQMSKLEGVSLPKQFLKWLQQQLDC